MRCVVAVVVLAVTTAPAYAQQSTCILQSIEKKLTGPALTKFMQACEQDVQKSCEQLALTRRLDEPNRTLFINSCVKAFMG